MTMPTLMNCAHSPVGWCLDCVGDLDAKVTVLRLAVQRELNNCTCEEYSCNTCGPLKAALDKVDEC